MNPADWISLTLVLGAGALLATRLMLVRARQMLATHETEERQLGCPRTASTVNCTLLVDRRSGQYAEVQRCSRFAGASGDADAGRPRCDQDCIRFLNLGIPLRTAEVTAEEPEEAAPPARG